MRKLDDIIPPSRRREIEPLSRPASPHELNLVDQPEHKFPYTTFLIVAAIVVISIGALFYFSSAKIEVTPNTVSAAVQGSFIATQSTGSLPYEIITAQKTASQSVKASGTKTVSSSSSGPITIYNTQPTVQKLIVNTRFATAGLIFRIRSAVTIPAGTTAKPGSVVATVYADKPGAAYDVAPASFTIPGFAGTPLASQVYARSSAAMTGGASGAMPVIDAATETQVRNALISALASDLDASIQKQIPSGYVLVPGASAIKYQELTPAPSVTTGMGDVKEQGTITAVVFPNGALAKTIAQSVGGLGYQGEPITLSSVSGLKLTAPAMPIANAPSFTFTLSGTAPLIYSVDPTRIAAAVSGKTRSAAEVALSAYPEVKRAIILLRPFWRQTFPQDPASITVVVVSP